MWVHAGVYIQTKTRNLQARLFQDFPSPEYYQRLATKMLTNIQKADSKLLTATCKKIQTECEREKQVLSKEAQ